MTTKVSEGILMQRFDGFDSKMYIVACNIFDHELDRQCKILLTEDEPDH